MKGQVTCGATSSFKNDVDRILNQIQCFCISLHLRDYVYVCNTDLNMWLTVKGGVYPSPIVPPPSLNDGGGSWYIRVCVCMCVRAVRHADCWVSPHVVDIRNQTRANRIQVRLWIALTCTNNPHQCVLISLCCISLVCNNGLVFGFSLRDGGRLWMTKSKH